MGFKCCIYGCKSGYASQIIKNKFISFHKFPQDVGLKQQWIAKTYRKDFIPKTFSRVCSLHFNENDYAKKRKDSNKSRCSKKGNKVTKR